MNEAYHVPVLLEASIEALNLGDGGGAVMDATFGGGGHSRAIMARLSKKGRLYSFDQDPDARDNAIDDSQFTLIPANFRFAKQFLAVNGVEHVDGIIADLGVSSHQFDTAERGFSLRMEGPLDMRMNPEAGVSAAELIEQSTWEELMVILRTNGEIIRPDKVARAIKTAQQQNPIQSTGDFIKVLSKFAPVGRETKFYAQVFQALRIEVNDELTALKDLLNQATQILKPGGRLVIISYHSLEDRLVKHFMRSGNFEDQVAKDLKGQILAPFKQINRKAVIATPEEVLLNPRARSARLRIAERTHYQVAS